MLKLTIKTSFLDRERKLIIDPAYIEFDNRDLVSEAATRIDKKDFVAFRFGIKWISGYQFIIGRIYVIDLKSSSNEIIKIRLKSLYGINKRQLGEKYTKLVTATYNYYIDDLIQNYLEKFARGEEFRVEKLIFTQAGVSWDEYRSIIAWEDLGTKDYKTYYSIFSKSNQLKYKLFEYLEDWNTSVIYSVSRQILKNKGFYSEE